MHRSRILRRLPPLFLVFFVRLAYAQADGTLQIHFMDVGQGDGAVLVSPRGETVLFDDGVAGKCGKPVSYLRRLGLTGLDYHIASHYHADHIGCAAEIFGAFPLRKAASDRGGDYPSATFENYKKAAGSLRRAASVGATVPLDSGSPHPVTVEIVALNGDGVETTNENDLSLVAVVRFGDFDAVIGGDLSGFRTDSYEDIESSVAPRVGQVEVYKVHHHGSRYSSNDLWLSTTSPRID